jgi:DNA-binding cell septation regulator SpoVG
MKISEVNLIPVKPKNGLVGFTSFVLDNCLYVSSVAIYTRPNGGYRCVYPTKQIGGNNINVFHPINRILAAAIEEKVTKEFEKLIGECNANSQTIRFP